jgi:glycosyltransferase involved in cell wall biosynthesis
MSEPPNIGGAGTAYYYFYKGLLGCEATKKRGIELELLCLDPGGCPDVPWNPDNLPNVFVARHPIDAIQWCDEKTPDIIIGKNYYVPLVLGPEFNYQLPVMHHVSNCMQVKHYIKYGHYKSEREVYRASLDKPLPIIWHKEAEMMKNAFGVFHQSKQSQYYFQYFYPNSRNYDIVQDSHMCLPVNVSPKPLYERKYDIIFIAGNWDNPIKNYDMVKQICESKWNYKIKIIGQPHSERLDVEDVYAALNDSVMLVNCSLYDTGPNIILEALSQGCWVISSKHCGYSDLASVQCDDDVHNYLREIFAYRASVPICPHKQSLTVDKEQVANHFYDQCERTIRDFENAKA